MAWRDTRTSRRRLLLYTASIMLGIAALVSIASLGDNLRLAVRAQSSNLLGADLRAGSGEPFTPAAEAILAGIGGRRTDEVSFRSMVLFPRTGYTRLVSVHAVEDEFPLYGAFDTVPASAAGEFRAGAGALVDESVMYQFDVQVGDEIKIGTATFTVMGSLRSVPGQAPGLSMIQPRVYMPRALLESTGVVQRGSRLDSRAYIAVPPGVDANEVRREFRERLRDEGVWLESLGSREARAGRIIENLERFLSLIGFVALLLGAVGVASGIHVFIRSKLTSIAVLRCVGATVQQTFLIYLVQAAFLGLVGAVAGALLGVVLHVGFYLGLTRVLPLEVPFGLSLSAIAQGIVTGVGVTVAVALLPLLAVRRVSPLLALRSTIETSRRGIDRAVVGVVALVLTGITALSIHQANEWEHGVSFVVGTAIVFGVLALLGRGLMQGARRLVFLRPSYIWRQGVANLFRPNNRTLLVILALGLGTFLILAMQLTQGMLLEHVDDARGKTATNLVFYDIQADQREQAKEIITSAGHPILRDVPIVTMRVASVKGRPAEELARERRHDRWVYTREYRSTYRETVYEETDTLLAGEWVGRVDSAPDAGPVPVSVEVEIAENLGVEVGDELTFDVQGVPVECVVGSIRRVDKERFDLWFFVVFPAGVLEGAPQFAALATQVNGARESADVQRAMLEAFPNVSAIDLQVLIDTMNAVLDLAKLVFWTMAAFVVGTGLVVLAAVMASGRFQRMRESVLLRTMGAAQATIARIQLVEYWMLGTLAALAGVLLAWLGAWALGRWIFELDAFPAVAPMAWAWIIVSALTVLTGWLSGRRVLNQPPLEILRQEV
jgi:putative ABC transport system permease protein